MGTNFAGISQQDQIDAFGGTGSAPPDTMGAVGPNHFVTMLRGSVAVYDKTGTRLSHVTLNSFFTTGSYPRGNCYSPRVIYDRRSGRWFAIALETNGGAQNHIILAVSATNDPTGTWRKYAILIGEAATTTDEAMLGTDDNGVYFGASMVPSGGSPFAKIGATRKSTLLAATPTLSTVYYWRNITDMFATPVPVHNQDAVASDGFAYFLSSSATVYANIEYRTLQWALSGVPTLSLTAEILTAAYGATVDAPAQGSTTDIDVGDDRIQMAVQRANGIWGTRNVGVTSSGGSGGVDRTAVEWFQINASLPGALALGQQGRVFDSAASDPMFYYYGSVMVSGQGHAALGFSGSNTVNYVGGYTCGRLSSDSGGTMQAIAQIKAGLASYDQLIGGRNRWGNYSATSLDPNDDMSIWTIQEYADSTVANPANVWGTWISRLLAPAPLITSAAGSSVQGVTNKVLNVTGARFFDPGTGYPNHINVTLSGDGISNYVITYNSTTSVTAKFDVSLDATIGLRDVTVTNPDGQTATAASAFEVIRAIPTTVTVDNVAGVIGETITLRAVLTNDDTAAGIPGKTLTFKVDGSPVGTAVTGADGAATLPLTIPEGFPIGDHVITASFAFDGTYRPSEGTGTGSVAKADTAIVADDKTAKIGATVALTATLTRVHDGAPVVGRTVAFKIDATDVGTDATDAAGVATVNYVVPEGAGVGTRTITAEFAGDGDYNPATDDAVLTVEKGDTALAVPNVVGTVGTAVDLTATLTVVGAGLPLEGKTVDIKVDGTSVGTDATDAAGLATVSYPIPVGMAVGDHAIGAEFAGDANYEATTGNGTLNVDVNTTIVADDASGMMGETVALSATLTRSDNGDPVAGKTLTFKVDGSAVGTGDTDAAGVASVNYLIPEDGGVGVRTITVEFAGDADYNASTDDASLTVLQTPTKLFVPDRSGTIGGNVELRGFLYRNTDSAPIAGRTIDFTVDGTGIGSGVTAATGRAILNWKIDEAAGAGTRTIVGDFAGDADFFPSSDSGVLTVNKSNTVLSGLDRTVRNGDNIELKAYLRRSTDLAWVAGRTIDFTVDGTAVGSAVTNASGVAALMYNVTNTPGQYPIGYAFAGDAAYNASTGGSTLTVTDDTTLVVDDKTAQIGATVALTATLTRNFDGAPVAGKTVDVKVDGTDVGSGVTDASGVASVDYLVVVGSGTGARTIEGAFAGDVVYTASTDTGTLTVEAADTTTVADDVTGKIHETVNLTATVTRNSDAGPVVGGTVDFNVDGTFIGSGTTDAAGVATAAFEIPEGAGAGARLIEATFLGDAEHNPSNDDATLTVEKADSVLTVNSPSGTAGASVDVTGNLSFN
ncbi:MAG: Ig-like domain repeat protein, partial [Armatimonadetes bacterium]|nr:Ig-like domain repeat protein [Armatimonadota bacterium]